MALGSARLRAAHKSVLLNSESSAKALSSTLAQSILPPVSPKLPSNIPECPEHLGERRALYCVECNLLVCSHCFLVGKHKEHKGLTISDATRIVHGKLNESKSKLTARCADVEVVTFFVLSKLQ